MHTTMCLDIAIQHQESLRWRHSFHTAASSASACLMDMVHLIWSMCTWQMAVQTAAHSLPLVSAHPAAPGSPASDAFAASSAASAGGGCRLLATADRSCCRAAGTPGPLCCPCSQVEQTAVSHQHSSQVEATPGHVPHSSCHLHFAAAACPTLCRPAGRPTVRPTDRAALPGMQRVAQGRLSLH
jgi:hypothetical protein